MSYASSRLRWLAYRVFQQAECFRNGERAAVERLERVLVRELHRFGDRAVELQRDRVRSSITSSMQTMPDAMRRHRDRPGAGDRVARDERQDRPAEVGAYAQGRPRPTRSE